MPIREHVVYVLRHVQSEASRSLDCVVWGDPRRTVIFPSQHPLEPWEAYAKHCLQLWRTTVHDRHLRKKAR